MAKSDTYLNHDQVRLLPAAFQKLTGLDKGLETDPAITAREVFFSDSNLLASIANVVKDIRSIFNTDTVSGGTVEACDIFLEEIGRFERSSFSSALYDRLVLQPGVIGVRRSTTKGVESGSMTMAAVYQKIYSKWSYAQITRSDVASFNLKTRQFLEIDYASIDDAASGMLQAGASFNRSASNVDPNKFVNGVPCYTAVDMTVIATMGPLISSIDDIKTLTYSTHRSVAQVYAGGQATRRGIARGHRTIAGTMICAVRLDDPMMKMHPSWMFGETANVVNTDRDFWRETLLNDQLPMFDVLIIFQDERGFQSLLSIFGIQISDVGQVMSINDSMIEITFQYTAADVDIMRYVATEEKDGVNTIKPYQSAAYQERRRRVIYGTTVSANPFADPLVYDKNFFTHSLKGVL